MTVRTYTSPAGFKQALETRLRADAVLTGRALGRQRQLVVFDRFLARIAAELGDRVIVKGGVVLELRLARARLSRWAWASNSGRSPKMSGQLYLPSGGVLHLVEVGPGAQSYLGDHLVFEVRADPTHPTIEGEGIVYEGRRFRAAARLAGKPYGDPFGVDAGFADRLVDEPEILTGSSALEFAGVAASRYRVYPRESHIAEKLHAFTLPRSRENTRVKDLPWVTIEEVTDAVREFLDPVLFGTTQTWDAEEWRWR